jgi:hypothetical protein
MTPCDWDQESYCINSCGNPTTHSNLVGIAGETELTELVCCACSLMKE